MLTRISNILILLLVPLTILAASVSDITRMQHSESATISILSSSQNRLSVECRFNAEPTSFDEVEEARLPVTRWIRLDGDALPTVVLKETTFDNSVAVGQSLLPSARSSFSPVTFGEPILQRGVRLVPVIISPFTFDETRTPSAIRSVRFEITLPEESANLKPMRKVLGEMWGDLILNNELPGRDREEESIVGSYIYVIPDNNDVRNTVNPLIQWRRQQGYLTREIICPEWADGDFIIQQLLNIDTPESPIDYILLVGDAMGEFSVPTLYRGIESDYYYTFLNGEDRIPDAAVGRLSFNSIAELNRIVNKVLDYERNPDMENTGWLSRAAVAAGSQQSGFSSILVSRWLRDLLYDNGFQSVDTLWYTMGGRIGDFMEHEFNRGVSLISYRGWTGLEDWSPIEAGALRNHFLPAVVLLACNSGDFAGQQTGFTEALLRAPGGAIAAIGVAGSQSRINFNNAMLASLFDGVIHSGDYRIGWALNRAKLALMATYGSNESELTVDHSAWTNLMGDPATIIWRGVPRAARITVPQQVNYGNGFFAVTVVDPRNNQPIPNVRVGFSKGVEAVSAGYTNAQGQATIVFDNHQLSPGAAIVAVSGDRIIPTSVQIQMVRPNQTLVLQSVNILEDNNVPREGDADGVIEPNESFAVNIQLLNIGSQAVPAPIDCQISTESEYCEVINANFRMFQPIVPNSAGTATFLVSSGWNFPDQENIPFSFSARQGELQWSGSFNISGRGARWTITRIDIGNPPPPGGMPSFDVFLRNDGGYDLGMTTANLVSDREDVEVIGGEGLYDSLAIGEIGAINDRVFAISIDQGIDYGADIPLRLNLVSEEQYTASIPFVITLAQLPPGMPTGPDAYGYYAIDNQDFGLNLRPNHRWEEINPRLGGPGRNTGILDQGEDDDESVVLDLPFTVQYYGEEYNRITVCSNGWAAFGSQPDYVDFRNMPIGSPQGPRAQLAPWWTDLYQPGVEAGIYYHYDIVRHRFIIEWYRMRQWVGPAGPGAVETFEIIINDPKWYQNTTGDGDIFFVYNEINHEGRVDAHGTPYATVGIGSPDDRGGLQLAFWNTFAPGVTPPNAGIIYRIVTATTMDFSILNGTVRREANGQPVAGAVVRATRGGWTFTDANGQFRIPAIVSNQAQRVEITAVGFNQTLSEEFNIAVGDSLQIAISLRQPQIECDIDLVSDSLQAGDIAEHQFTIRNPGNGRLSLTARPAEHLGEQFYRTRLNRTHGIAELDEFGDRLLSIPVSDRTGDSQIFGVAYTGAHFIISGGDPNGEDNTFYRFDEDGEYIDRTAQPINDALGMRDLAWDGVNLYGGSSEWIVKMNRQGVEISRIESPIIPARAIAIDTEGNSWITGENQPIVKLNPDGEVLASFTNRQNIHGLAWHPEDIDGMPLWILSTDNIARLHVSKMDTATGAISDIIDLEPEEGDRPGGIELSRKWDDRIWVLSLVVQNVRGDRVDLYEVGNNFGWISVEPASATLEPNLSQDFTILISSEGLSRENYSADILIDHDAEGGELRIPVEIYVEPVLAGVNPDSPTEFVLDNVFPNPANGFAQIRYYIPVAGLTSVSIYDSQGRLVTLLADQYLSKGHHSAVFDAASYAAGVYMVVLKSDDRTIVRKFAAVK